MADKAEQVGREEGLRKIAERMEDCDAGHDDCGWMVAESSNGHTT